MRLQFKFAAEADFHLLVDLKEFNTERMNEAVFEFRRYEDASLHYVAPSSNAFPASGRGE